MTRKSEKAQATKPDVSKTAHAFSCPAPDEKPFRCEITCKPEVTWWGHIKPAMEIVGVVLLGLYTWYTVKMFGANKDAADAAKSAANTAARQLELSERPWVSASPNLAGPLWFDDNGANIVIGFKLHNSGQTPAIGAFAYPKMKPAVGKQGAFNFKEMWDSQIKEACGNAENVSKLSSDALFASSDSYEQVKIHSNLADLVTNAPDHSLMIQIPVCTSYKSSFNETVYTSGQIYTLSRIDPQGREVTTFPQGVTITPDKLRMALQTQKTITLVDGGNYNLH
jgi:hypothetical protein